MDQSIEDFARAVYERHYGRGSWPPRNRHTLELHLGMREVYERYASEAVQSLVDDLEKSDEAAAALLVGDLRGRRSVVSDLYARLLSLLVEERSLRLRRRVSDASLGDATLRLLFAMRYRNLLGEVLAVAA